ncbi:MAG: hypothetical protein DMF53_03510, partial [Acidobacteria bacterium]
MIVIAVLVLAFFKVFWTWVHPSPEPEAPSQTVAAAPASAPDAPERLKVKVLSTRPHDPGAFTQWLVLAGDTLFESTGLNGK